MASERRTYATPLYPGAFLPEHGRSTLVNPGDTDHDLLDWFREDQGWFCLEFVTQPYERWASDSGGEKWEPVRNGRRTVRRIYVGEVLDAEAVADLPGDHRILLSNMASNHWDRVVKTRAGNYQPLEDDDVVLAEQAVS